MRKISPKLIVVLVVALFFGVALGFRVYFPYSLVFGGDGIRFTGVDAYYHMRLVDNLVHNFPHLIKWDYYLLYPGISGIGSIHFFDWLLAAVIWVIGLGSPTQHTIDVVGVYYPAVLGALTVIPVFFLGKELFGRWAGVMAAGLLAVLPGEFLGRSILGFTDYHVAEALFTATAMLFLVLAVRTARQRQLTFSHIFRRDWPVILSPVVFSLFSGLFLGAYLITWPGALLFIFIISVYLIIQFTIDHIRRQPTDYLCATGAITFLVALVVFIPFSPGTLFLLSLVVALFIPLLLGAISWLMTRKGIKPAFYPLALVVTGLAGLAGFYAFAPSLTSSILGQFSIFTPHSGVTTLEMQPILSPVGNFTLQVVWGNFTSGFFLAAGLLLYLIFYKRLYRRQDNPEENILLVWSVVILLVTIAQRRFAYYFAVNVALLAAYVSWQAVWWSGLKKLAVRPAVISAKPKPERKEALIKKGRSGSRLTIYHVNTVLAVFVIFFLVFFPNIPKASAVAAQPRFAPSEGWQSALTWLKDNTPDPFGDPGLYYELYQPGTHNYPEAAYGVLSWWDYGYWITRIAHRVPVVNPSQPPKPITDVSRFFLSQDEAQSQEMIKGLGASYIVIDYMTATSKYWAVVDWAGAQLADFFDVYLVPVEAGKYQEVLFYFPEYYRSMCSRLYNFDGKAVTDVKPWVITYDTVGTASGPRKRVTDAKDFSNYQEALDYIQGQGPDNHRLVGTNPFVSPVPLEELSDYNLAYSSGTGNTISEVGVMPEVKVFEYTGDRS